jgi:hypothetical protein
LIGTYKLAYGNPSAPHSLDCAFALSTFFCIFSPKNASPEGLDLAQPAILDTDLCNFTEANDQQEDNEEEFTEEQPNRFMELWD